MPVQSLIPTIDLGQLGIQHKEEPSENEWIRVAEEIVDAFENVGCVSLVNHGVSVEQINRLFKLSSDFFALPQEEKDKYTWDRVKMMGYTPLDKERLNPNSREELRESYNVRKIDDPFPDEAVPDFREVAVYYMESCETLGHRFLTALSIGLGLDRNFFSDAHDKIGSEENGTFLRVLNYPPITSEKQVNTTRCGAHTDYGSVTFLLQDELGGLQVKDPSGNWVQPDPNPSAIFAIMGDLMRFWSAGRLRNIEHRVIIPEEELLRRRNRQSIAYFINTNDNVTVSPLDGSSEFEPVNGRAHLYKRLDKSWID